MPSGAVRQCRACSTAAAPVGDHAVVELSRALHVRMEGGVVDGAIDERRALDLDELRGCGHCGLLRLEVRLERWHCHAAGWECNGRDCLLEVVVEYRAGGSLNERAEHSPHEP